MAGWEEFSKMAGETARGFSARAKEIAETTKLNGQIAIKKTDAERLYGEIGKAFFATRAGNNQNSEELEALCAEVETLENEIGALQGRIDVIRRVRRCKNCGEISPESSRFCGACGTKFEEEQKPVEAVIVPETPVIENVKTEDGVEISWPQAEDKTEETENKEE